MDFRFLEFLKEIINDALYASIAKLAIAFYLGKKFIQFLITAFNIAYKKKEEQKEEVEVKYLVRKPVKVTQARKNNSQYGHSSCIQPNQRMDILPATLHIVSPIQGLGSQPKFRKCQLLF